MRNVLVRALTVNKEKRRHGLFPLFEVYFENVLWVICDIVITIVSPWNLKLRSEMWIDKNLSLHILIESPMNLILSC